MTSNDILRRLRYAFDYHESHLKAIYGRVDYPIEEETIAAWLKNDDDPAYRICPDRDLAAFLNGLIIEKRGAKEGPKPVPEDKLNNNIVFKKLRIALNLQSEEILEILEGQGVRISKHELSAFFRNPDHKHYRSCKDQVLRNFLTGIHKKYRPQQS